MFEKITLTFLVVLLPTTLFADGISDAKTVLEMYTAVLTAGLCLGQAIGKDFPDVSELVVLNQLKQQGYVNENGSGDCNRLNSMPVGNDAQRYIILGATHLY